MFFSDQSEKISNHFLFFQHGLEVMSRNDEKTLGVHLDLYSKYMESVKVGVLDFYVLSLSLSLMSFTLYRKKDENIQSGFLYLWQLYLQKNSYILYICGIYRVTTLQEMLFRRTCLMVSYEEANKALEKAKPNKREAVRLKYLQNNSL